MIFRVAEDEHVVSVARIDEDDEVEVEALDGELAPEEGATVEEDELDKPVDPALEEPKGDEPSGE